MTPPIYVCEGYNDEAIPVPILSLRGKFLLCQSQVLFFPLVFARSPSAEGRRSNLGGHGPAVSIQESGVRSQNESSPSQFVSSTSSNAEIPITPFYPPYLKGEIQERLLYGAYPERLRFLASLRMTKGSALERSLLTMLAGSYYN
jgi:hypothetical protein